MSQKNLNRLWKLFESKDLENVPNFLTPASDKDLKLLFNYFNKKYFGGKLPKTRLKFVPLAKRFHGKTHVVIVGNKIKDSLITVATFNKNDREQVINTILHEMIHVWQYFRYAETGDNSYLDDTYSFFAKGEVNLRGHGKNFKDWSNRFNKLGFKIDIADGFRPDLELTNPFYGIVFYTPGDVVVLLTSKNDPTEKIDEIIKEVEKKAGDNFYTDYTLFKTTNSKIITGTRLTKSFKLPKNVINIMFKESFVQDIVNSKLSKIILRKEIEKEKLTATTDSSKVPPELVQTIQLMHKHRGSDLETYYKNVLINTKQFKHLMHVPGYRFKLEPDVDNKITPEIIDYIKKDWETISDQEIKRSNPFRFAYTDVKLALLQKSSISKSDLNSIMSYYNSHFKDRVDFDRFKRLLYEFLISKMLKDAKKIKGGEVLDKEVLEKILRDNVFKGTILESLKPKSLKLLELLGECYD